MPSQGDAAPLADPRPGQRRAGAALSGDSMIDLSTGKEADMLKDYTDRVIEQRKKMAAPEAMLRARIEASPYGPRSREGLHRDVACESPGTPSFAGFECPPYIVSGKGELIYDADGKEYLDFLSSFSVLNVGHSHPKVVAAITEQAATLLHYFEYPTPQRVRLAERLVAITPGSFPKKVAFTVTGSEAIELAIKLARWYTGAPAIVTCYGDYHGNSSGTIGVTGKAALLSYYFPVVPYTGPVFRIPFAYCYRCPFGKAYPGCDMQCVQYLKLQLDSKESPYHDPAKQLSNVAAVVMEPMQSSAGYYIPPDEFLRGIKALCEEYGMLFIADEIQSGMGRTGRMWSVEHAGVVPDITAVAKSIGGGIPMSAIIARQEILESWGPGAHTSTFAGNAVACAAANAVLDIYETEGIVENARIQGQRLLDGLLVLQRQHLLIGDVQGKGLYAALEFVRDRGTKDPAVPETVFMHTECVKEGLICQRSGYYSNRFAFLPTLVITAAQVDRALTILDTVIGRAERQFGFRKS
jgi:4-aminobutyrate aminotransferase